MGLLVLGIVLWTAVHLIPTLAIPLRTRLIGRIGFQPYQGLFSLALIASIVAIVLGWRSLTASVTYLYLPPPATTVVTNLLMFVALILFVASVLKSDLNRQIRHPQLTGMAVWAGAHLLSNGELRSLVLFGGMFLWALIEIVCINRRDGAWQKPEQQPPSSVLKPVVVAAVAFVLLFLGHPYFAAVSPMPR